MKQRLPYILLLAVLLLAPAALRAQIGVYAAFSGASLGNTGTSWGYGPLVGIYKQSGYGANTVSIGGDLRGSFITRNGFHYNTVSAGPRIAVNPHVLPFKPYIEGLIGVANYNNGTGTSSSTHFSYQIAGGIDSTILPKVDWRVIDIAYSAVPGQPVNATTFSTGIVLRIW